MKENLVEKRTLVWINEGSDQAALQRLFVWLQDGSGHASERHYQGMANSGPSNVSFPSEQCRNLIYVLTVLT